MDPWYKVDYSRLIREASMAMEKLPEVDPPFGKVTGSPKSHDLETVAVAEQRGIREKGICFLGFYPEG